MIVVRAFVLHVVFEGHSPHDFVTLIVGKFFLEVSDFPVVYELLETSML